MDGSIHLNCGSLRRCYRIACTVSNPEFKVLKGRQNVENAVQRRLVAILAADVVGFSRLTGVDEDRTLARLRALRSDLIDPTIEVHNGRVVKRTGDGAIVEFRSVVDAVRCAIEVQNAMIERNAGVPPERRIEFRIGIHLGDVVEESDGDLMGDGVNIAARLEGVAAPGAICLSEDAYRQVKSRLDLSVSDLGETRLKNISDPMRVYSLQVGLAANSKGKLQTESTLTEKPLRLSEKPSIAVLPFQNMSGDSEQEYFSEGISEDIITELSRFRNLFVIARNTSFIYKGRAVDVKRVGSELGVAYVLEGSVRRAGNRVRITAQLIDAESGSHIWADRFDRELADVFAVQDEITLKIVGMLTRGLEDDALERAKRKPPESISAYEHWLRGKRLYWTYDQENLEARRHFESAARIDPSYSRAYSGLAVTWQMEALSFSNVEESRICYERSMEFAEKALKLDEADYQAHISIAWTLLYGGEYERMKRHIDRALMLNPNDADTLANSSYMLAMYGDADAAIANAESAVRLNPRHPDWYSPFHSTALFTAHRYEEAFALRKKLPDYFIDSTFFGAAMLAQLGRLDEARQWGERAVTRFLQRTGGVGQAKKSIIQFMLENNPYRRSEDQQHLADALRKAGVPG
jgi:adenylate cyclase